MFEGLPAVGQFVAALVLRRRLRGPLGVVVYHHLGDLLNAARHALGHYFPISLDSPILQNSSLGTPYQKWAFFTNKDFQAVDECLRRLLVAAYHYYAETNDNSNRDEFVSLKDAWTWFHAASTQFACCSVERNEPKLSLSAVSLDGWLGPDGARFLTVRSRLPQGRDQVPAVVTKAVVGIGDRTVIGELHRAGLVRLGELRRTHEGLGAGLRASLSLEDVIAAHGGHLSQDWVGVVTTPGVPPPRLGWTHRGPSAGGGYQVIEPARLASLYGNPKHLGFAVAVLHWLVRQLRSELRDELAGVEVEVIPVTYLGTYPAIGVRYTAGDPRDVGPLIESAIDRLLRERPVVELADFVGASGVSWAEVGAKLVEPGGGRDG